MNIPRDIISAEEAEKIHNLATQIIFSIADCGPEQVSNVDGKRTVSTRLRGFQAKKAREIIKDKIEHFILRGY